MGGVSCAPLFFKTRTPDSATLVNQANVFQLRCHCPIQFVPQAPCSLTGILIWKRHFTCNLSSLNGVKRWLRGEKLSSYSLLLEIQGDFEQIK
ncbi:hypothetical protein CEXT_249501 [Caerostris extrusa]|uniref:Uncharacterized protein n=1 Tax=Caerostris extrusa TaxID=172846 RepID=A0AAV4V3G5_CAEEX|nr:hypothetical protein CEXT_249501 [Caerostris extrusa]